MSFVAPHFAVCVVNDDLVLRCVLNAGAATIVSDVVRRPCGGRASDPYLRCILSCPNIVTERYQAFAWDATLLADGRVYSLGVVRQRCEVIERRIALDRPVKAVQLRLARLRLAAVRTAESDHLARSLVQLMQEREFNPRGGSLPLGLLSDAAMQRHPQVYDAVVVGEHLGSFRGFIGSHYSRFCMFQYDQGEIEKRKMPVMAHEERVALRKDVRDSQPPMLPRGHPNESVVLMLLQQALAECDCDVHSLLRVLSGHDAFRVCLSSGFSSLMHWLQRHSDTFQWSTDPESVCTIRVVASSSPQEGCGSWPDTRGADPDVEGYWSHPCQTTERVSSVREIGVGLLE